MRRIFSFPNPVNEYAARTVAAGVVLMAALFLATGWTWLLVVLVYGFAARVAAGPRFSPLGQLAVRVIAPRLPVEPKLTPGPPKRFAQSIGLLFSTSALILALSLGTLAAQLVIAMLLVAALLESALGICLGCKAFALLMRLGLIPASVCAECGDLSIRYPELASAKAS